MSLAEKYKEKDIENQLVKHITKFLLELGKGFAFVGQQYHIAIADNNYYIDLLFYHIKLKFTKPFSILVFVNQYQTLQFH